MSKRVLDIKYNLETMNVVLIDEIYDLLNRNEVNKGELNIDVRDYITIKGNQYLIYILEVIDRFDYVLRQHIIKFTLNRFKNHESRKSTSINAYIDSLEKMKFIRKMKLNNNNYYMLTQKGYIFLKQRNNVQAKRKPDNSLLRERIFFAQYYLDHKKDIEFDFVGLNIYFEVYKNIYDYLKVDTAFYQNSMPIVNDYIEITNVYREYYGLRLARKEGTIIENGDIKINSDEYIYTRIEIDKLDLKEFLKYLKGIKPKIEQLIEMTSDGIIRDAKYKKDYEEFLNLYNQTIINPYSNELTNILSSSGISKDAAKDEKARAFLHMRLIQYQYRLIKALGSINWYANIENNILSDIVMSPKQYLEFQLNSLDKYLSLSIGEQRNAKRDVLSTLQYSKIYISGIKERELEFTILDLDRRTSWYSEKLLEIDKILRRINMFCKSPMLGKLVIYVDDPMREEFIKSAIQKFIKENKKDLLKEVTSQEATLNYINKHESIYFIKDKLDVRLNGATSYFEKGRRDKWEAIGVDEIIIEKL